MLYHSAKTKWVPTKAKRERKYEAALYASGGCSCFTYSAVNFQFRRRERKFNLLLRVSVKIERGW